MAKFMTAINCMDGRTQLPVIDYLKRNFQVDYVDVITMPGPNRILAEQKDEVLLNYLRNCIEISVKQHGSNTVAIIGHYDCAGNPADKETQHEHIRSSIKTMKLWNFNVKFIGLWVNEFWQIEVVSEDTGLA